VNKEISKKKILINMDNGWLKINLFLNNKLVESYKNKRSGAWLCVWEWKNKIKIAHTTQKSRRTTTKGS
jgi:hypothetical protein